MNKACLLLALALSTHPSSADDGDAWVPGQQESVLEALGRTAAQQAAPAHSLVLGEAELRALADAAMGERLALASLRTGLSKSSRLELRRIDLRAPGTATRLMGGPVLAPSKRRFFLAADGDAGLGLVYDPGDGSLRGLLNQHGEQYRIRSTGAAPGGGLALQLTPLARDASERIFRCELDGSRQPASAVATAPPLPSLNGLPKGADPIYQATVAVDTDNEFLANKFGNDTTAAADWIEEMFLFMNVIYERDLQMRLLQGDTILRPSTTADPYSDGNDLGEFSTFWLNDPQLRQIDRAFVILLSGQGVGANSFSGVAWLNQYCVNTPDFPGQNFGSFSFNGVGSASFIDPAFVAGGVGHEIGHNLGSRHTHCERLANGGTNFVDHCYNENFFDDCYAGPTECVADGVGSLMSYCHAPPDGFFAGDAGPPPGSNCTNSDEFDPLIIAKLLELIEANNPECIADFEGMPDPDPDDLIFDDGFEVP